MTFKQNTLAFLILIVLTLSCVIFTNMNNDISLFSSSTSLWLIILATIYKGYKITDIFMELQTAPTLWRLLISSYVILIPSIIGIIYWLPMG